MLIRGWLLATAAVVLSLERITYVCIARWPGRFHRLCRASPVARLGEPVAIVRALLYAFKAVQFVIFAGWCLVHGGGSLRPAGTDPGVLGLAVGAVVVGQFLNCSVFYRLGTVGVVYGARLGHDVPWCRRSPFRCARIPSTWASS